MTTDINQILDDRQKTHGNFDAGAQVFDQLMKPIMLSRQAERITPTQFYALVMDAAKTTRILIGNANEIDHWQDKIGYITLGANLHQKQDQSPKLPNPTRFGHNA